MQTKATSNAHLMMLLHIILVAGSFPVAHAITDALPPVVMMWLRFLFAAMLFIPLLWWHKQFFLPTSRALLRYALLSIPLVAFFWCMFEALRYTSALNTGAIYTIVPAMTAGMAFLINGERTTYSRAFWLTLGTLGAIWIIFRGSPQAIWQLELNYGDWLFLLGCLFMSINGPMIKYFHRGEPMALVTFWMLLLGSVWLLLAMLGSGAEADWHQLDGEVLLGLLYLTLFTTLVTFLLFNLSILKIGVTRAMAYSLLTPLLVLLLGLLVGGDAFEPVILPGALLLLMAMVMIQLDDKRRNE